jgi:hypothetical protein
MTQDTETMTAAVVPAKSPTRTPDKSPQKSEAQIDEVHVLDTQDKITSLHSHVWKLFDGYAFENDTIHAICNIPSRYTTGARPTIRSEKKKRKKTVTSLALL